METWVIILIIAIVIVVIILIAVAIYVFYRKNRTTKTTKFIGPCPSTMPNKNPQTGECE
jgi:hypothetical protein